MKVGKCPLCGGGTNEEDVEVEERIGGKMHIIKGIKAEVCTQCGERMYSENELRCIEKIRDEIAQKAVKPIEIRTIEVFPARRICPTCD